MSDKPIHAVLIAGPTASGKSALAIALAKELKGTVINADAMQVYDGLRVITARPSVKEEAEVPHRLYGTVRPSVAWSVGDWTEAATLAARETVAEGRLPIFVGGTGMYLSVLSEGISPMPEVPQEIRDRVRSLPLGDVFEQVKEVDPASAERIGPTDPQRLQRALEIYEASGEPLTEWQARPRVAPFEGKFAKFILLPERQWVYDRIERRFEDMVESGAVEEVRALMELDLDPDLPAMKALGVPQILAALRNEITLEEAIGDTKLWTRRFAKRQMTWFRNQMIAWNMVSTQQLETQLQESLPIIVKSGLTLPE